MSREPGIKKPEVGSLKERAKNQEPGIKTDEAKAERLKAKGLLTEEQNHSAPGIRHPEPGKPPTAMRQPLTESTELQTENRPLQTEEMEVHHHPQLEHKPKPWKEYLLEGLMIFLAVTMGFFAESLREHITNNEREDQYVRSIIEDIKDDRGKLEIHIRNLRQSRDMLDSLISILNDPAKIAGHGSEIYYFGRLGPRLHMLPINMRTFEQLKNSGSFRLISKIDVSNRIMSYYQKVPYMRQLEGIYTEEFASYKKIAAKVFEPAIFRRLEDGKGGVIRATDSPPLQKDAGGIIKELSLDAIYMNASRKQIIAEDEDILKSASDLLSNLQKEYHLEDE